MAGLKISLRDGKIASVELDGDRLPAGGVGGFYLRQPNDAQKVPMVGNAVSKDGKLQLTLTSPLQAKVSAVLTEGEGFLEVAGELDNLTGTDRGLWLGFNVPVNTTGWKWGQTLSTRAMNHTGRVGRAWATLRCESTSRTALKAVSARRSLRTGRTALNRPDESTVNPST